MVPLDDGIQTTRHGDHRRTQLYGPTKKPSKIIITEQVGASQCSLGEKCTMPSLVRVDSTEVFAGSTGSTPKTDVYSSSLHTALSTTHSHFYSSFFCDMV